MAAVLSIACINTFQYMNVGERIFKRGWQYEKLILLQRLKMWV